MTSRHPILDAIGNTPMVKLQRIVPGHCADIYVKLEYFNPTGSYKDRMAVAMIDGAEASGKLKPGMTVVEATAGNTGTSLAFVCSVKGYAFRVVSSDAFSKEKLQSMKLFGAELELIPAENGKITPDLVPAMIRRVKKMSSSPEIYWTAQFENKDMLKGYRKMGHEILLQVGKPISVFCAAAGTSGMLTGVSQVLREMNGDTRIILLEPASAPLVSSGIKGSHTVDGISVGFMPPILKPADLDDVRTIEEAEARNMARLLAAKEGIFGGTSTGLNVAAAIKIGMELGPGHNVVTVACDSGMKYLASGLFDIS
ncbi:pyridoxal-phosphate dependent enzyme [Pedobacter sp. HMF7056]|uniref:Cysteine synthase n=2 Tax=Hufsiella ginkgonis TaxID=2695274 RepID=A0A7K1Y1L0_9SPHI|nr:pyridoxal-phosphate dependent enzyme [Hufsiella ginkgonis]